LLPLIDAMRIALYAELGLVFVLCARKQARDGGGLVSVVVYSVSVVMQKEAVYGLTEINREEVRAARLVANPGCYPTSVQLPLIPLLQVGLC